MVRHLKIKFYFLRNDFVQRRAQISRKNGTSFVYSTANNNPREKRRRFGSFGFEFIPVQKR